ncbi:MAG: undecaprenyldiphospho-muramoylpentapeptide beta-N-acetylglucosaminyltransferase [Christensenellales bacterium]
METIVLTGGGTAGHVTPNLALIPKLKEFGFDVEYIGTKNGMEREIIEGIGIPYHIVSAGKFRRYFSIKNMIDPFKIVAGVLKAECILTRIKPAAVFSKGGFVSVPVVIAASRLGIPVVLHESDYTPGLANKICIPRASKVCVAFKSTLDCVPKGKGVYTGLPIRKELLQGDRQKGLKICGFKGYNPVLLIMGGSLGAKALNDTVDNIIPELLKRFDVVHIRGRHNMLDGVMPEGYRQFGYVDKELSDIYAAADIMISRAGATAVFEILALSLPALLVPLPKTSSRGDQLLNADYFKRQGFSYVLEQEKITDITLLEKINQLYEDKDMLRSRIKQENIADAAGNVARIIADARATRA